MMAISRFRSVTHGINSIEDKSEIRSLQDNYDLGAYLLLVGKEPLPRGTEQM